jgi:LmbE family N-acetylglucosaminyl deacetylase
VAAVLDDAEVQRVLCVMAHPDDVDFGSAGTVALWAKQGIEIAYCLITDGDAGGFDPAIPRADIAGIRRAEQTEAAAEVGVTDLTFLGYPDGRLEVSLDLRRDISRVIRQKRPDRVIAQSPERNYARVFASHPDHLAAGEATLCAVYPDARNPFTFTELMDEGLEPWSVREVWMGAMQNPNRFVDITDTVDLKLAALRRHESQLPDPAGMEERVRMWVAATAKAAGLPDGAAAEGYMVIET